MVAEERVERLPLRYERPGGCVAVVGRKPRGRVHLAATNAGGESSQSA